MVSSVAESQVESTRATTKKFSSDVTDKRKLAGGDINCICISCSSDRVGAREKEKDTCSSSEEDSQ